VRAARLIALGSSSQIALFVAPVLVLLSYVLGPAPMDLQMEVMVAEEQPQLLLCEQTARETLPRHLLSY